MDTIFSYNVMNKKEKQQYDKKYRKKHKKEIKEWHKNYYKEHKEKVNIRNKKWRDSHKEYIKQYQRNHKEEKRFYMKKYEKEHRMELNQYFKNKMKKEINFKIRFYLKNRLYLALKGNPKLSTTMKLVGCSIEQLKKHLETQFKPKMTWHNYGKWHIDHIRPCACFNLSKLEEQKKCFHYTNLQPLWAEENLRKGKLC